jgi:diguanylate cyclase
MAIDVDHFKQINDTHGHEVGDCALRAVTEELTSCVREDIAFRTGARNSSSSFPGWEEGAALAR